MTLVQIQNLLNLAISSDLDGGAEWVSQLNAEQFNKKYPALNEALERILRAKDDQQEQTSANRRRSPSH
jgi:hypothetical protein